jgi:hypothetical protein
MVPAPVPAATVGRLPVTENTVLQFEIPFKERFDGSGYVT